ncbi:MAG: HAD family phosphatase [Thermoanaerobaculia bacterium]|jgi:HAD superfamily hydrolase (TIGR01509 family)
MLQAAIFDFDETMVLLEEQHDAAASRLALEHGDDYHRMPASFRHRSGHRVIDDVDEMRRFFGWPDDLETLYARRLELFLEECREHPAPLLPGVAEAIAALESRGMALAIASSGLRPSIEEILENLGVLRAFRAIIGGEDVTNGKPDPEPYLRAAAALGVEPRCCLVFEDSSVGVASAKAAGAVCIAVRNALAKLPQQLDAADLVIDGFPYLDLDAIDERWGLPPLR